MPHTTRQDTVKAHDKVAKLKEAAEYFGLELKTASDYAALQSLMDRVGPRQRRPRLIRFGRRSASVMRYGATKRH